MSPRYGELRPTSGWDRLTSLGYPCKFQLVSRLDSVTARHLVVGVSQTLRRWTEGATYIRQCDHHVGHWPTFLVVVVLTSTTALFTLSAGISFCCSVHASVSIVYLFTWLPHLLPLFFTYSPYLSTSLLTFSFNSRPTLFPGPRL